MRRHRKTKETQGETVRNWFYDQLQAKELSLRSVARMLGMDPSALSLAFRGKRRITMDEAVKIARIFGAPLEEVYAAAGITAPTTVGLAVLDGVVGPDMRVEPVEPSRVAAPVPLPDGARALQFRTTASPADMWDRWVVFYDPRPQVDVNGRLCVVTLPGGIRYVRTVMAGYRARTWRLLSPFAEPIEDIVIEAATPVLWIQQP